ncbi:hypothetical protein QBC35DRAFT_453287 [Podospora australis]|uniref:polynucleotide adenylyltransferase n=1 Tax=Podospora australis TaxID=1536484 RepID=A0AAN7AF95_9PEZI|nr:hypothetical protein QBC35DRAFT_453287 [Podospora australis]
MDGQPTAAETQHLYHAHPWSGAPSTSTTPRLNTATSPDSASPGFYLHLPLLWPHVYQDKLLQYNRLIGGRGGSGLQGPALAPVLSSPPTKPTARSRSSSKVSNKDHNYAKPGAQSCHGNRPAKNSDNGDRALITSGKEQTSKMAPKKSSAEQPANTGVSMRPPPPTGQNGSAPPVQSSSVPSTPHQHARKFSFESREPSPGAAPNHSPRSAYSETNGNVPSLRPLPPRLGNCRFETAVPFSRRRMPYSLGADRLEKVDSEKIKSRLSEDEERRLQAEMDSLFQTLLPTEEVESNRKKLVSKLETLFNEEWPGHDIKVHLFGSSGNLLCSDDSDVDICITTPWKELEHVCMIAELLHRHGMQKVVCVSSAKVPIVKIWDPELQLACDMNVNNTSALENTRMVRTYVSIDERVRPLAMIIKYWTRRRIVNDAAFGATLSSYTWICLIIAFLQLREPPVLPALHEQHSLKLVREDGRQSEFADDIPKLKGFGARNKENTAELLFQFFRFYAYEFDYDQYALSIRLGKLLLKTEKKWHIGTNNTLCVEEPFNLGRNLGNTADDTSFRGLHMELRRAFDLIAEGKFEECCEQYVYPKEEERTWQKPQVSAPRPVLLRSSSQQQPNRGGRNGFRGNRPYQQRNNNNNGNAARRASSSVAYETHAAFAQGAMPVTMNQQDLMWYQAQNPQIAVSQELLTTSLNALAAQENNMRFQLYTQAQHINQQQAIAHAQRMQGGSATDRSRTSSFDNPPLTAPIRPELMYGYGFPMQQAPYFHPAFTTFPSSPASTAPSATPSHGLPEFRRPLHRTTGTGDSGISSGTGTLRSQSQPASRGSMAVSHPMPGYSTSNQLHSGVPMLPSRQVNGMPMPNLSLDEASEAVYDDASTQSVAGSPPEGYAGIDQSGGQRRVNGLSGVNPALNTVSSSNTGRRRLSTDQTPQSVLDRRLNRTSRSPSPLRHDGHVRTHSVGQNSAPLPSATFSQTNGMLSTRPLVVNGSLPNSTAAPAPNRSPLGVESTAAESASDYSLSSPQVNGSWTGSSAPHQTNGETSAPLPVPERPVIVNGSTTNRSPPAAQNVPDIPLYHHMMAMPSHLWYPTAGGDPNNMLGLSRLHTRQLAPLDLATSDFAVPQDLPHLSPVYEHRTPSPTVMRKLEPPASAHSPRAGNNKEPRSDCSKTSHKPPPTGPSAKSHENATRSPVLDHRVNGVSRENGHHHRPSKSPTDSWQRSKTRKKGAADTKHSSSSLAHSEQLPKNEADRKGG